MKITTTNYKQKFPTFQFLNCDIGFDGSLEEGENPLDALKQLKTIAEAFHKQEFPHLYNGNEQPQFAETSHQQEVQLTQPTSKEEAIQSHIKTINECTTLSNLNIFTKLVQKTDHPDLTAAYQAKLKTFDNG